MSTFEVPLAGTPERFTIALNGTTYQLKVQWREDALGGWFLDIADASGDAIVAGIALVTGSDLLEQYGYLNIAGGAALYLVNSAGGDATAAFANLGTDVRLHVVTP